VRVYRVMQTAKSFSRPHAFVVDIFIAITPFFPKVFGNPGFVND
jgi:hypothetical protein